MSVLRTQHRAGRLLTERIQGLSTAAAMRGAEERRQLGEAISLFIRMYRPQCGA